MFAAKRNESIGCLPNVFGLESRSQAPLFVVYIGVVAERLWTNHVRVKRSAMREKNKTKCRFAQ